MATLSYDLLNQYRNDKNGLCGNGLDVFAELVGTDLFDVRHAAHTYIKETAHWLDVVRAYQVLVENRHLPDVGMVWRIARIAFRETAKGRTHESLAIWGDTLGPDNWRAARSAADAIFADDPLDAVISAARAGDCYDASVEIYDAAASAIHVALRHRVMNEIVEMIVTEVERVFAVKEV